MIDLSAQDFRNILEQSYRDTREEFERLSLLIQLQDDCNAMAQRLLDESTQPLHDKPSQDLSETVNDGTAVPSADDSVGTE